MAILNASSSINDSAFGLFAEGKTAKLTIGDPAAGNADYDSAYTVAFFSNSVIGTDASTHLNQIDIEGSYLEISTIEPNVTGENFGFATGLTNTTPSDVSRLYKFGYAAAPIFIASDVGNLAVCHHNGSGSTSGNEGFAAAGQFGPGGAPAHKQIDKFPFAISSGTAIDVGDLAAVANYIVGHTSELYGFSTGGGFGYSVPASSIERYPFAINSGTAVDIADMSPFGYNHAGHSSSTHGYASGGRNPSIPQPYDVFQTTKKFPFAITTGSSTSSQNITEKKFSAYGHSSNTDAYVSGGFPPGFTGGTINSTSIDKFPFANNSNATSVGDLSTSPATGQHFVQSGTNNSKTTAFAHGAIPTTYGSANNIMSFPFAISSGNATQVGLFSGVTSFEGSLGVDD